MANIEQEQMKSQSRLRQFYAGKRVLITGTTGFVGKVCLIKMLTSLQDIDQIYVVMRPKKGMTAAQRLQRMMQDDPWFKPQKSSSSDKLMDQSESNNVSNSTTKVFSGLDIGLKRESQHQQSSQSSFPNAIQMQRMWDEARDRLRQLDWSRVKAIDGDLGKPELGFNEEAKQILWTQVDIVLNIAASVDFNAPLKSNLRDNYNGIRELLSLAVNCKRLISFAHVSTFYTNSHHSHIEERVLPMERDCEKMADLIEFLPEKVCNSLENEQFMESRPNTYIYTKAMAEELVQKYEGRLPLAIVRPSIIVPSLNDPVAGWVDNVNGPMGLGVLASLGILRTIDWNYDGISDFVPCDHVANSILAVAERTARKHPKEIKVYNCSSSSLKPTTWGQTFEILRAESIKAPPYKMLRIPITVPRYKRANPIRFQLLKLNELLFAYFIDLILMICGQKRLLVKLTRKLHHGYAILKPFTTTQYTCSNDNLMACYNELEDCDKREFDFDISKLDWAYVFQLSYYGARMSILKERADNVAESLVKMRILLAVNFAFKLLIVGVGSVAAYTYGSRLMLF